MNNDALPPKPSHSTAEVARLLGVSTPTVQRWVDLGYLKAWKTVGGHRRIDGDSLARFMAAPDKRPPPPTGADAVPGTGLLTALVVDDNPDDRDLICALVDEALPGIHVKVADNGFEALVAVGRETPQLVITDIVMPHMNGLEMLRFLSGVGDTAPRLIVAVSSLTPPQLRALGELPDGVRFLGKPLDPLRFVELLRSALPQS